MPPPLRRSLGAIPEKAPGVAGAVEAADPAPPEGSASLGLPAAVCPGVPGGGGPGATTDATSTVPAGGGGMAA